MNDRLQFLPQATPILRDEKGVVLITALMILVLLTIIGIASTNVSNTETKIATSEAVYQQNLYRAEGATLEAVVEMERLDDPKTATLPGLLSSIDAVTEDNVHDVAVWEASGESTLSDTSYLVNPKGIALGSSLDMGSSKVHSYVIYGRCAPPKRGATTVEIGYLKAF